MKRIFLGLVVLALGGFIVAWRAGRGNAPVPLQLPKQSPETGATTRPARHEWQSLFNGRDLTGWRHVGGGRSSVKDGLLILEHDAERRSGYLVSNVTARNFNAKIRCQVPTGDSGFYYRARFEPRTPTDVLGPQVQLNIQPDTGLGGLFEAQGRGWLSKPSAALHAQLTTDLEWIEAEVEVGDDHVRVTVNGITTVDFTDRDPDNRYREAGFFALQIHGGGWCDARFQDIAVLIQD